MTKRLPQSFYLEATAIVAKKLLGQRLVRVVNDMNLEGTIVETEAYLGSDDPACHAAKGLTPRTRVMFERGGIFYIYSIHSRFCLNVVTENAGIGAAVLIRAIEPTAGHAQMERFRYRRYSQSPPRSRPVLAKTNLTNGPGKLCEAMDITTELNGVSVELSDQIWIEKGIPIPAEQIAISGRIGIRSGCDLPLRFFINGNKFVSGKASDHTMPRKGSLHGQ